VTNRDFRDLFSALNTAEVRYLIVGAYAVTYLSREDLIRNERMTGRQQDLEDVKALEGE
jgi:hypothetical protein